MASFPGALDAVASKVPGRLAMVVASDGSSLTYQCLAERSAVVAQGLRALGVLSREPLLSHMHRGCDWYILYVAVSRLGVPLAAMPVQAYDQLHELRNLRWTQLLALRPQLLVVDENNLPTEVDLRRHSFKDVLETGIMLSEELPAVSTKDVLCYCFTGGTTGRQRCVPVTHGMALHELRQYPQALHWQGDSGSETECARVLQASSLYWASAVFGQLDLALALQGCAVVSEDIDVKDLASTVREQRVNILGLPPSMLSLMEPTDLIDTRNQGGYCHVRRLISWGEPCPAAISETWGASRWPWRFLDILISTEYWLSFVASERDPEGRSLFTPVKDLEVYLHPLGRTAEDGMFSELCLRGPGVCESCTADGLDLSEAFLEHQGQRFYRSGDLAKWSEGGEIVFTGRGDQLVKVFGKWVDLSELSRRLSDLPGVLEAATVTGGPDEHHAIAVLDVTCDPAIFSASATKILPSGGGVQLHWVYEPLPRKMETQKVDRAQLLSQLRGHSSKRVLTPLEAPPQNEEMTRQQEALVATITEVLGHGSFSLQSSFFACGGDSVTALRCAAVARQRGLEISALSLLSAKTLAQAAEVQEDSPPSTKRPRLEVPESMSAENDLLKLSAEELQEEISFQLGLPKRAVESSWPCTAFQDLLLNALEASEATHASAADLRGQSPGTLQSCALLSPSVSLRGLQNAWRLVQQRCSALRSRFVRVRSRHIQVALRSSWSKDEAQVIRRQSGDSLRRQLQALMKEDLELPFSTKGPLCRLRLLQGKAENSTWLALLLSIHNSICDGWSANLLLQDLMSLSMGLPAPEKRLGHIQVNQQVADHSSWWRRTLEGFRPRTLQRQGHLHSFDHRRLSVHWETLRQRAVAWQMTPAALILTAWSLVWSRATGNKDFLFGAVLSGREAVPSDLLGCTASLVPFRVCLADSWQSLQSFALEVQRCLLAHASMWPCPSLTEIRNWCGLPRGQIFECAWIFDHTPPLPEELCQQTGFDLVCEHEVPAAGAEAETPELRVIRRGHTITTTLRGVLPQGEEGEAQILLEELDAMLAFLAEDTGKEHTVWDLLLAVPLLPCVSPATFPPKAGEELAAFWRHKLSFEATELPRSQGTLAGSASWKSVPFLSPSTSKETMIAAIARVLGRMSGQEDVSVIVPLGHKHGHEGAGDNPMGWFPLRASSRRSKPQVSDELADMEQHALAPRYMLERLLAISPLKPSTALIETEGPLCRSAESMQRWGDRCCHLWQTFSSQRDVQGVELVVVFGRSHGCGMLIFNDVRGFDLPLARIFARHLSTSLSLATPSHRDSASSTLDLGIATSPPLLRANLLELLIQSAKRTPRSIAIAETNDMLNYSEIFSSATVTSKELCAKRNSTSHRSCTVAVLAERSAAAVVGLLATMISGAAYCPLIPSQPLDRLVSMVSLASITEMLFQPSAQSIAERIEEQIKLTTVCIRLDASSRTKFRLKDLTFHTKSADDAMHVLFTSGSTGMPKVIRASHTAVMTHLLHVVRHHQLQATDVALQHTSLAWVAAAPEIWTPLLASAQLAVAPMDQKGGARDLETLASFAKRCTLQQYVPSALQAMLLADLHPLGRTCRHLVLTGEPLPMDLCHRVLQSSNCLRSLRNHYGQTEAADTTTVFIVEPSLHAAASVPLGRPATQRQVWLEHGHGMCDTAELGELLVGGPGLHLDKRMEGSRLGAGPVLHTGDLARWVPIDGSMQLVCLGRKDRQVKVRGHRLELLEIEAVMKHEAETLLLSQVEALVTFCPTTRRLVAYVQPPLSAPDVETLLKGCRGKLLAHAMPTDVIGVEEWPRTSSGKIDRKALQPQTTSASEADTRVPVDASQYLRRSAVALHKIKEKGWQVLGSLLFGLATSRASVWRLLLLPMVWNSWHQLVAPRHKGSFAQDLAARIPALSTSLMVVLLPWRVFLAAAVFAMWRLGRRSLGMWTMWWMGLSSLYRQVLQEFEWYSWYLRPDRSLLLMAKAFAACKDLLSNLRAGHLPAKRPCEWDWDTPQRRPRQRPRLDYVWVDIESAEQMKSAATKERSVPVQDLSLLELKLLEYLQEEAGVRLDATMPLATAFDSLRLTALVGGLRKSLAPQLSLRDALACDTVADLLKVTTRLAKTEKKDTPTAQIIEPCFFKVREWPYMFSMSVCWALEADDVEIVKVQTALEKLLAKHGALSVQLADPPALWDLAMEAAANLSLARAMLQSTMGDTLHGQSRGRTDCVMDCIGGLLWTAWPRLKRERYPEVNLDVIECEDSNQLELRSAWLLDGRNGRQFLENPMHAVLLKDAEAGKSRVHLAVSHGLSDGFSGLPLLQDFINFYNDADGQSGTSEKIESNETDSEHNRFCGLLSQEARLKGALMVTTSEAAEVADISSWALSCSSGEGFDHFIWLQQASMQTLQSIVEHRMWCCSLDVAVLAVLGCALARLSPFHPLRLRFVASARDQGDEGTVVADLADSRDLDFVFSPDMPLEDVARCIADCVRYRRWTVPDPRTSGDDRIYINVRPLLEIKSQPKEDHRPAWQHITQWPPVEGERNWDRRNVNHALWIMADQVSLMEWVFCLKIRNDRSNDKSLGRVLEQVIVDLALQPEAILLPNAKH